MDRARLVCEGTEEIRGLVSRLGDDFVSGFGDGGSECSLLLGETEGLSPLFTF